MSRTQQRFEGSSIEDALAAAVASLGPDVEVTDARKVRSRGMLGFFAKEHYEVLAEPKLSGDVIARAEASLDDTLQSLMARIEAEETPAAFAATLAAASAEPTPEPVVEPAPPAAMPPAAMPPAPVLRSGQPQWSRAALRELGIHEDVLNRLAVTDGDDDEDWTIALVNVLRRELTSATICGFPVVSLHFAGADLPATAMELTLAVRSCLPR